MPRMQIWAAFPAHVKEQGLTLGGLQELYEQVGLCVHGPVPGTSGSGCWTVSTVWSVYI